LDAPIEPDDVARLRSAISRIARQLGRQVGTSGLTQTQLSILATVNRRGPIGAGVLADIEGLNPTMLSRTIVKLDDLGLLRRTTHPDDGRAVVVEVTAAGARMQRRLRDERTQLLTARLAALPEGRAKELLDALDALDALVEEMAKHGVAPPKGSAST
jgi:DNA-binding MarR family transcriptional regulator